MTLEKVETYTSPRPKSYVATYAAALLALLCSLVSYHLSAQLLGPEGFSEFATGKRILALAYPVFTQGLSVGLAHHIARCALSSRNSEKAYVVSSVLLVVLVVVPFASFAFAFPGPSADLLFGSNGFASLVRPLPVVLLGTGLVAVASSFLVGRMSFIASSLLTALSSGIIPLLALLFVAESASNVFWGIGLALTAVGGLACCFVYFRSRTQVGSLQNLKRHTVLLLDYTLPRLPGVLGLSLIVTLPVILTARNNEDFVFTGVLALACTFLVISQSLVQPLALVLLPHTTRLVDLGRKPELKPVVRQLFVAITVVLVPLLSLVAYFAEPILDAWIGHNTGQYAAVFHWTLPIILPFAYFECFKSVLDGTSRRAYTTEIVGQTLVAFVLCFLALSSAGASQPVLPSLLFCSAVLGLSALWHTKNVLGETYDDQTANRSIPGSRQSRD